MASTDTLKMARYCSSLEHLVLDKFEHPSLVGRASFIASSWRRSFRLIFPEIVFGMSANSSRQRSVRPPAGAGGQRCRRRAQGGTVVRFERHRARFGTAFAGIGARDDPPTSAISRMLDNERFQLERRNTVVRRFEYIVCATDVPEVVVAVTAGDVARAVEGVLRRRNRRRGVAWNSLPSSRTGRGSGRIETSPSSARSPSAPSSTARGMEPGFGRLTRRISEHRGRVGLSEAVPNRDSPRESTRSMISRFNGSPAPIRGETPRKDEVYVDPT